MPFTGICSTTHPGAEISKDHFNGIRAQQQMIDNTVADRKTNLNNCAAEKSLQNPVLKELSRQAKQTFKQMIAENQNKSRSRHCPEKQLSENGNARMEKEG